MYINKNHIWIIQQFLYKFIMQCSSFFPVKDTCDNTHIQYPLCTYKFHIHVWYQLLTYELPRKLTFPLSLSHSWEGLQCKIVISLSIIKIPIFLMRNKSGHFTLMMSYDNGCYQKRLKEVALECRRDISCRMKFEGLDGFSQIYKMDEKNKV